MRTYTVLSGSTRKCSQTGRVARWVAAELAKTDPDGAVDLHDLSEVALPAWREEFWDDTMPPDPDGRSSRGRWRRARASSS